MCNQNLAIHWKIRYYKLQLYKLKLNFKNHTTKIQFVVNDDLFMDLENPQMLQCIVYKSEKTLSIILSQSFVLERV